MAITTATQGAEILNQSLRDLGQDYQIDTTNPQTIEDGYKAIAALAPSMKNNILSQVNTILVFRNYGTMFNESKNPIRRFLRNDINFGGGEEDIWHDIIDPVTGNWAYDYNGVNDDEQAEATAKNLVRFYKYNIHKKFHTNKIPIDIPMSITEYELKQLFTPAGFARYIDTKMANLQWSAEVALLDIGINAAKQMVSDNKIKFASGFNLNTQNGVTSTVEYLRTATDAMENLSDAFNYANVRTISSRDDVFLFITPEFLNRLQTRGYANAFNVDYYREHNQLIILPYGTDLGTNPDNGEKVLAMLIDRRALVLSIMYWQVKPFVVSNTDYINYFLKAQILKGYNEFFNAVAITGADIENFIDTEDYVILGTNLDLAYVKINGFNEQEWDTVGYYKLPATGDATWATSEFVQVPKNSIVEFTNAMGAVYIPNFTGGNNAGIEFSGDGTFVITSDSRLNN